MPPYILIHYETLEVQQHVDDNHDNDVDGDNDKDDNDVADVVDDGDVLSME